jgi:hypothetical protein
MVPLAADQVEALGELALRHQRAEQIGVDAERQMGELRRERGMALLQRAARELGGHQDPVHRRGHRAHACLVLVPQRPVRVVEQQLGPWRGGADRLGERSRLPQHDGVGRERAQLGGHAPRELRRVPGLVRRPRRRRIGRTRLDIRGQEVVAHAVDGSLGAREMPREEALRPIAARQDMQLVALAQRLREADGLPPRASCPRVAARVLVRRR